jgi:hypothetical protein
MGIQGGKRMESKVQSHPINSNRRIPDNIMDFAGLWSTLRRSRRKMKLGK